MEYLNNIGNGIAYSTESVFNSCVEYLPNIFAAIIVILIGYFMAIILEKMIIRVANTLKVNSLVSKTFIDKHLNEAGIKMKLSVFLGKIIKWIVLIIILLVVVNIFKLTSIELFINQLLVIVGRIITALIVFAITVYVARFTNAIAVAIAKYINVKNNNLIAQITSAVIYLVGILVILDILQIEVIKNLVTGIIQASVFGVVIAFSIAFGLGGRERAKNIIDNFKK